MKVLELFAGTCALSNAFKERGHQTYTVEWNKDFKNITLYEDINNLTKDIIINLCDGIPDIIWASPDCTTYSIASISKHRKKNEDTGNLDPVSDYAKFCDKTNKHLMYLINEINPKYYFIENPRGAFR